MSKDQSRYVIPDPATDVHYLPQSNKEPVQTYSIQGKDTYSTGDDQQQKTTNGRQMLEDRSNASKY